MKRVLIITYYWPPGGGAGVQRWLKFVKYFGNFGIEPVVYTPSNPENPVDDTSLLRDIPEGLQVLKTPIWEPYNLYKKFSGRKPGEKVNTGFLSENKKPALTEKISVWLRGNLFIPDARKFWIRPSVRYLGRFIEKNKVDAIVSTGPPHSMHLIALALKRKYQVPWLADFRDPWTNIDYYKDLMLSSSADKKHHRMEKEVLREADTVVTIGETMKEEFETISSRKVEVITNGYDNEDLYKGTVETDKKFSLAHIGTLVRSRNPASLWKVLEQMIRENETFAGDLEIKLVGKVDVAVNDDIQLHGLSGFINKIDYVSHEDVIKLQQQSQVLLLLLNDTPNARGILTGKFFEYLAARRPVLCIGPVDGDAAKIIQETGCGRTAGFHDQQMLREIILSFYGEFRTGNLQIKKQAPEKYSRKELTSRMAGLLKSIIKN